MTKRELDGHHPWSSRSLARVGRLLRHPDKILPAVRRRVRSPFVPAPVRAVHSPNTGPGGLHTERLSRKERIDILIADADLQHGLGLEIGPSHNPLLPKAEGYIVLIADHLDQAGLTEKYGYKGTARIEPVLRTRTRSSHRFHPGPLRLHRGVACRRAHGLSDLVPP